MRERRRRSRSPRRDSQPRRRVTNEKREPSLTLLYVSNLPFTVEDAALQKIFAGFKVSKAYVAKRGNGRSKGFGFVEFANNEEQQKALKLNGQEFEGRPLTIQVANKVEDKEAEAKN
jgi:RNA recognition motif-containing protein